MAVRTDTLASSRLRRLAQSSARPAAARIVETEEPELCELCNELIPAEHRHVLDLSTRDLKCACRKCSLLFDRDAAGGGHFRLVPDRRLRLEDFDLPDLTWERLRLPVDMAFFFKNSREDRVMAYYPSPMGPTESLLELSAWRELEAANPVLETMAPDVEALLVNRARDARRHWLVPIEECYALVGLIRTRWRGLSGGPEVWGEIARFFHELDGRSGPAPRAPSHRPSNGAATAVAGRE